MQSAVTAINRSQSTLAKDAAVIANPAQPISRDTIEALISSRQQVLYTQAGAKLIAAADQMTQGLIDITA
jgi:hypothetical protein